MSTRPHVFLFDANADGVPPYYGGYFDPTFLRALSSADPDGKTCSRIKRGDATMAELVSRVIAVHKSSHGRGFGFGYDIPLYETIIWDLTDAIGHQWHTLELDAVATIIAKHNLHCIMLPDLPTAFRSAIDQSLRGVKGYLGAFEIDPGNPVQRGAFCDLLVYNAAVIDGQIVRDLGHEGGKDTSLEGAEAFQPKGAVWRKAGWLHGQGPPDLPKSKLSERGAVTASLIARKRTCTIQGRVLERLAAGVWSDANGHTYSFEEVIGDVDVLEAVLPDGKFTNYLFKADHKEGRGKAKFFTEELGIARDDWRYLAAQLYEGLILSGPRDLDVKWWDEGYGAKFTACIRIIGRNGETRTVRAVWMMEPGKRPRLCTAYPESSAANPVTLGLPPILAPQMSGEERWTALYALAFAAGDRAQAHAIPTPLKVEGSPLILDGKCGWAAVTVKDARTGFARWLIKSGHGHRRYRSGARVFYLHPSQSYDRAKAFAMEFARVLIWNGVPATVDARYD